MALGLPNGIGYHGSSSGRYADRVSPKEMAINGAR